jgi:hypothetical protein
VRRNEVLEVCCHILVLKLGQPIVDFESMKMLFDFLKVKNMFCKH